MIGLMGMSSCLDGDWFGMNDIEISPTTTNHMLYHIFL
jgi:hypothetical protein